MAQPSSSGLVEGHTADIALRLDAAPVLIEWAGPEGQRHHLGDSLSATPVSLDMTFDPTTQSASIRLRIVVQVHRDSSTKTPLYIYIGPEDIDSIGGQNCTQPRVVAAGACFHVKLRRPLALIGPPFRLRPSNKTRAGVVNSARAIASQRDFFFHIHEGLLSIPQRTAICEAVYSQYRATDRHQDIASLYGGQGGKKVAARDADANHPSEDECAGFPPPSYDELEAPPPMAPLLQGSDPGPSSKKRRLSSSAAQNDTSLLAVEAMCRKLMAEQQAKTECALRAMEDRLATHLQNRCDGLQRESQESRTKLSSELKSELGELRGRVDELGKKLDGFKEKMSDELEQLSVDIQAVSDDIENRVDFRVDDTAVGVRIELEDFIHEELKDVEEAIKESLRGASVSIDIA